MQENLIINYIENEIETDYLDFKAKDYDKDNNVDFLKDIMSMANSSYSEDKYIIVGVKDSKDSGREVLGIEKYKEQSELEQLVEKNIEPTIKFEFKSINYHNKIVGYYRIFKENIDVPYMLKKQYGNGKNIIKEGECFIRKNSTNSRALRRDYDKFYKERRKVKVSITGFLIFIRSIKRKNNINSIINGGCVYAPLEINIFNNSKYKTIIIEGYVKVKDSLGNNLCEVRVVGYDKKYMGADFKLELEANDQYFGDLLFGFGSSNCVSLGLDEYGESTEKYKLELVLFDTEGNEYVAKTDECFINAEGDILHKVRLAKSIRENKPRVRIFQRR